MWPMKKKSKPFWEPEFPRLCAHCFAVQEYVFFERQLILQHTNDMFFPVSISGVNVCVDCNRVIV